MKRSCVPAVVGAVLCTCSGSNGIIADPPAPTADLLGGKDCDSLVPTQCGFPYPSSVYLISNPSMPSGRQIKYRATTLPPIGGNFTVPTTFDRYDGFSPSTALLTHLPGATTTGLPSQDNIALSITTASPTILLEVNSDGTWRFMPHFSELDVSTYADAQDQAFMIRPVTRLKDNTRYIAAIRNVVDANGNAIAPTSAFQALRDGTVSKDASVAARRGLYENIFHNLAVAGIPSKNLQMAWDYYTASDANTSTDLIHMRDLALAAVGTAGPQYTITTITPSPDQWLAKRIEGMMRVPLFQVIPANAPPGDIMDYTILIGQLLNRDASGLPAQSGWAWFPYLVQVPNSLTVPGAAPGGVLQNGHGLLGSRTEGQDDYFARLPDDGGYVGIAVDLWGFNHDYVDTAEEVVQEDAVNFLQMVEGQDQGFINELVAMRMMIGSFANDPELQYNGHSIIDTSKRYYRGDSQGGIMGATYMSISTDVTRGYLGEPGYPYNMLLNRSSDFSAYYFLVTQAYQGPREPQLALGLLQQMWDRSEPTGFASHMTQDMFPNTPQHAVLMNCGIGDFQVTPLGAHIMARTIGAVQVTPVNRHLFGIDEVDGPLADGQSGIMEFNFQLDQNPNVQIPETDMPPLQIGSGQESGVAVDCDPHDKIREETAVFKAQEMFFSTGQIENFCTGQALRPADDTIPGSCQFDYTIPYVPVSPPVACSPG